MPASMLEFLQKCFRSIDNSLPHRQVQQDLPWFPKFLQMSCLKPNYSLRRQLVAGYGITAFVTVFIVVFMATIAANNTGAKVRDESIELFQTQLDAILQESGVLTGDILDKKMNHLRGSVNLLVEIVRDRIVGYPYEGWEDDRYVPFVDRETGRRMYPLKADLLPRDFEMTTNLNVDNSTMLREQIQERAETYAGTPFLKIWNTESSMFTFQGNCDPTLTDPNDLGFYPFCTEENNDASLGGKINPTETLAPLEQKAADIGVFTKAIFEAQPLAHSVGVWFVNSGAGAGVQFPSFAATPGLEFTSSGCDWMKEINNYTGRPYGTDVEIKRCTPEGMRSTIREYNGLERMWCADQALNPGETRIFGPYAGATWLSWRLTIGRAVFDRKTGELIACTHLDLSKVQAEKLLDDISEDIRSDMVMVLTKVDGTVVVGANQTNENGDIINQTPKLWNTDYIDEDTYNELTADLAFWEGEWDIESARNKYNITVRSGEKYFTVFPSPIPPDTYDPSYEPDFLIFSSIEAKRQDYVVREIKENISEDTTELIVVSMTLGVVGLLCMMIVIVVVAKILTRPLEWMDSKAKEIIRLTEEDGEKQRKVTEDDGVDQIYFCALTPRTEINELVSEFRSMVAGFSGTGASTVAVPKHTETKNYVTWKEDFRRFYDLSPNLEQNMDVMTRSVSRRMSKTAAMRSGSHSRRASRGSQSRRASMRRTSSGRNSSFKNSSWKSSVAFPMSASDFEQILAAADEEDEYDNPVAVSSPVFQSTQITGEPTRESHPQMPGQSSTQTNSSIASHTIGAAAAVATPLKPWDSEMSEAEKFPTPPTRINLGSNISHDKYKRRRSMEKSKMDNGGIRIVRSPLFWTVLLWIVVPLFAAIVAIMIMVGIQINGTFPQWINEANETSYELELEHLKSTTDLIKKHTEQLFVEPLHDLYTIHRLAGWVLFGAVDQSNGVTDVEMDLTEDCKSYDDLSQCPFFVNETRSPCPCGWNDPWRVRACTQEDEVFLTTNPRYIQKLWYLNQKRRAEKFPEINFSPNSTLWYTDPNELEGSEIGFNATGPSTAYSRFRVTASMTSIIFPVYNYGIESRADGYSESSMSGYISFDADGSYSGFSGCNYDAAGYAKFYSNDANKAYTITDNCPKGQYGYDPRCRGWYDNSKQHYLRTGDLAYITPPYRHATVERIGVTAVSALRDPISGEFLGNTLVDFETAAISKVVDKSKFDHYALILPNTTKNVIASSEFPDQTIPKSLLEVLAPYDLEGTPNYDRIVEITQDMENEGAGEGCDLYRTDEETGSQTQFCYVYEPLFHRQLKPMQSDDFARGAVPSTEFLYSIIMLQEVSQVSYEFAKRSDDINQICRRTFNVYMSVSGLTTIICLIVAAMISLHVTRPVIQLLQAVKKVNAGGFDDDMPPLTGGSREVHQVYASFAKLYKTIRLSNWAFFAGDLARAYRIARGALRLFRKIGDNKAIGIACNNMGCTLLAWMVEVRDPGSSLELDGDNCTYCTEAAIKYFNESIALGTEDFEAAGGDAEKAKFAQQLADRHFNRAMCLLLTADDPCALKDAKEIALDDLHLVRQYDQNVKEYMLQSQTLLDYSDVIFERSLRRLHGLAALIDIEPDVWDVWDVYELVDQADLMLQAAWDKDELPLFNTMSKIGRLQELEGAVSGIEFAAGKSNDAVQLVTRMFIEDEYLLDASFIEGADCILQCSRLREEDDNDDDDDDEEEKEETGFGAACIREIMMEFKTMRKVEMRNALDIGRAFIFCIDLKGDWNGQPLLTELRSAILNFYEENFQPNDTVGIVTFVPKDGTLRKVQPFSAKDLYTSEKYPHRDALVTATTGVACSRFTPALQGGIDMALEVESNSASDVCLLYVSDGGAYDENIFSRLQRRLETSSKTGKYRSLSSVSSIDLVVIKVGDNPLDVSRLSTSTRSQFHQFNLSMAQLQSSSSKGIMMEPNESSFEESCKGLVAATRSRASVYLEGHPDNLDEVFRLATASINKGTSFEGNRLQRALTMQKF